MMFSTADYERLWTELDRMPSAVQALDDMDRELYVDACRYLGTLQDLGTILKALRRKGGFRPSPEELETACKKLMGWHTGDPVPPSAAASYRMVTGSFPAKVYAKAVITGALPGTLETTETDATLDAFTEARRLPAAPQQQQEPEPNQATANVYRDRARAVIDGLTNQLRARGNHPYTVRDAYRWQPMEKQPYPLRDLSEGQRKPLLDRAFAMLLGAYKGRHPMAVHILADKIRRDAIPANLRKFDPGENPAPAMSPMELLALTDGRPMTETMTETIRERERVTA